MLHASNASRVRTKIVIYLYVVVASAILPSRSMFPKAFVTSLVVSLNSRRKLVIVSIN